MILSHHRAIELLREILVAFPASSSPQDYPSSSSFGGLVFSSSRHLIEIFISSLFTLRITALT
jgi:hypothetical protein